MCFDSFKSFINANVTTLGRVCAARVFFTTLNHCSRFLCLTATGAPFKWYCFISEFLNLRHSMALVTAAHMSCSVAHTRASQSARSGSRRGGGYSGTLSR